MLSSNEETPRKHGSFNVLQTAYKKYPSYLEYRGPKLCLNMMELVNSKSVSSTMSVWKHSNLIWHGIMVSSNHVSRQVRVSRK